MIYFDSAASYPVLAEVQDTLSKAFETTYANPSSSHVLGVDANFAVNDVRAELAEQIGAYSSEIVFTSGATESNNIAFKSVLLAEGFSKNKNHIVTTQIEHKCVFSICNYLELIGFDITYVKPEKDGLLNVNSIERAIRPETALVSVMHVNNELGTINPIREIGELCSQRDVLFHSDAAQSFMKIGIDVDELNVDLMSFSAHKIGGPKGIGAVYIRDLRNRQLLPILHGAGQEDGLRGGTVATPLILGFGSAIKSFPIYYEAFKGNAIRESFLDLLNESNIDYQINGSSISLPSCVSVTLPSTNVSLLVRENEKTFCLAQGSACSSKEIEASHVLNAIGLSREQADKTLRISFSLDVSKEDIVLLVKAIKTYS